MSQPELPLMDEERFYSPRQVGEKFDVTANTIRLWIRRGKLRAIRIGPKICIPESAIRELAQEQHGE